MLQRAVLIGVFLCGFGQSALGFCLYHCVPSEADGKAVLENYGIPGVNIFGEREGKKVVVKSFKKVNGEEGTMGATYYTLFYDALVEFPDGKQQQYTNGHLTFEKTEKGWLGQDGKVY